MFPRDARIEGFDPELAAAIAGENRRQEDHVELIASENYASPRVMEAQGSRLTNKYAEGYPGKRYYGGCEFVDVAERLAIERCKQLFGADYANVQPHSGSQANQAVYLALLNPGDTILGMSLAHGGHLTHGAKVNISGKLFNAVQYGVDEQGPHRLRRSRAPGDGAQAAHDRRRLQRLLADRRLGEVPRHRRQDQRLPVRRHGARRRPRRRGVYPNPVPHAHVVTSTTHKTLRGPRGGIIVAKANEELEKKLQSIVFPGIQGGPLMHVIAAKAVAFKEALEPEFKAYQQQVVKNAQAMANTIIKRGYKIVSGGTQNHLMLVGHDRQGHHRQGRGSRARQGAHHREQERRAERSGKAVRDLGPAPGHAGRHHARLQRSRVRGAGQLDLRRAGCAERRGGDRARARRGDEAVQDVSGVRRLSR
jgi:glycine hydroxymethyltransferase